MFREDLNWRCVKVRAKIQAFSSKIFKIKSESDWPSDPI